MGVGGTVAKLLCEKTFAFREEAKELNELFRDALSGKTRNWRDVDIPIKQ